MFLRTFAAILLGWLLLSPVSPCLKGEVPGQRMSAKLDLPDIIFVQAPTLSADELANRFPEGSKLVKLSFKSGANSPAIPLTPEFFAAGDPQISFNGGKVLFSAQKAAGSRWQVWEMNADGANKRQITNCPENCLRAAYLSDNEIVYSVAGNQERRDFYLAVANRDGSQAHRITFGPGDLQLETVLSDGRILASASWPLVPGAKDTTSRRFYTLRPDGTALDSFGQTGDELAADAEELDDGSVIYLKSSVSRNVVGGELAEFRRGATRDVSLAPPETLCLSPRRWAADKLIVARWIPGMPGTGKFDLYAFDLKSGNFGDSIFADPQLSSFQAVVVKARPQPRSFWSTLNPQAQTGYFICLDSRLSADEPKRMPSKPIVRVRVLMLEPRGNLEQVLGDAPVESDGSFYIAVPADGPVRFELLDPNGQILRAQKGWIWSRPGEQRGCTGCHADQALAPENHWPLTLRRFDTPTQLGVKERQPVAP